MHLSATLLNIFDTTVNVNMTKSITSNIGKMDMIDNGLFLDE
jgi:hypothetical protein